MQLPCAGLGRAAITSGGDSLTLLLRVRYAFTHVGAPIKDPRETLPQIREACHAQLPGATFRRHLLFRYSIVWHKPLSG